VTVAHSNFKRYTHEAPSLRHLPVQCLYRPMLVLINY